MFYFEVMEALYRQKIRYLLVGGLSVNLYGIPRVTQDIDLIISMSDANVLKLVTLLKDLGFVPRLPVNPQDLADSSKVKDWIDRRNLKAFSFFHGKDQYRVVDIVLVHPLDFDLAFERRTIKKVRDIEISLVSIDDLIIMKEFSGRDQDLSDVAMLKKFRRLLDGTSE